MHVLYNDTVVQRNNFGFAYQYSNFTAYSFNGTGIIFRSPTKHQINIYNIFSEVGLSLNPTVLA